PVRSLGAGADRDLSGREVHDQRGDEERRDASWTALRDELARVLDRRETAEPGADDATNALRFLRLHLVARVFERHLGGRDRELNESVVAADLFVVQPAARIKVLNFAGERGLVILRVEARDRLDAALAVDQRLPGLIETGPARRHAPHAGDDDSRTTLL